MGKGKSRINFVSEATNEVKSEVKSEVKIIAEQNEVRNPI